MLLKEDLKMYLITAKVEDINTVEGRYKNVLIAEKHKRRLEKKYPGTDFEIKQANKKDKGFNDYYTIVDHLKRKGEKK